MRYKILLSALGVLLLLFGSLMAGVKGSKHDFTSAASSPTAYFAGTSQVCVFCHTTHNAVSSIDPLWNHETNLVQTYQMYDSPTLDMTQSLTPHTGSLICLSCHDGTIAINSLNNLPGPEGAGNYGTPVGANLDGSGKLTTNSDAYVGTDLNNDHPVGITYDSNKDNDFVPKSGIDTNYPDKLLYDGLYVECSSCHDPHDNTFGSFLVESNANSNLCTRCHIK